MNVVCWKCGGDDVYCYECGEREGACVCEGDVATLGECEYCLEGEPHDPEPAARLAALEKENAALREASRVDLGRIEKRDKENAALRAEVERANEGRANSIALLDQEVEVRLQAQAEADALRAQVTSFQDGYHAIAEALGTTVAETNDEDLVERIKALQAGMEELRQALDLFEELFVCPECWSPEVEEVHYADDLGPMRCRDCRYTGKPGQAFPTGREARRQLDLLRGEKAAWRDIQQEIKEALLWRGLKLVVREDGRWVVRSVAITPGADAVPRAEFDDLMAKYTELVGRERGTTT